jgi:hypothetical protein
VLASSVETKGVAVSEYKKLNDVEFDHPFKITKRGEILGSDWIWNVPQFALHAPEVYHSDENDVDILSDWWWAYSGGYTGQFGYSGPVMHASELLGGRLERDMMADPGIYVVTSVECYDSDDAAGWIVLKLDKKAAREKAK